MPTPRILPSIERLRQRDACRTLEASYGRTLVVDALRTEVEALRASLTSSPTGAVLPATEADACAHIEARLAGRLHAMLDSRLRPVINATGVIVHTNLGRAPLSPRALARVAEVAGGYSTLEYDLGRGGRGARDVHAEPLLCRLTGAEAAVVVNNNAAATMLVLAALARGREVIISRGELVEIGGGFRVPDILTQSGALLREVGTTNRTRVADYGAAITERTGAILRVHPSNFTIQGFVEAATLPSLVALGREFNVPVVEDLGSGYLFPSMDGSATDASGDSAIRVLDDEPTPQASVAAGAGLVCFSGDKLLGGPQAGIIVGERTLVERVRRHPLMRAFRVDKMTYAALEGTLMEYVTGRAAESIPVLRMLRLSAAAIDARARFTAEALSRSASRLTVTVVDGMSTVGGGSAPSSAMPTRLLALAHATLSAPELDAALRALATPVIARIVDDRVALDLRTVMPEQDARLVELLSGV
ncbi:MAG: L-seryl-tRNA(Sec) selenium transferase [Vicinamibacterales bacterium]